MGKEALRKEKKGLNVGITCSKKNRWVDGHSVDNFLTLVPGFASYHWPSIAVKFLNKRFTKDCVVKFHFHCYACLLIDSTKYSLMFDRLKNLTVAFLKPQNGYKKNRNIILQLNEYNERILLANCKNHFKFKCLNRFVILGYGLKTRGLQNNNLFWNSTIKIHG